MYFIIYYYYKSIGYVWRGIKTIFRHQKLYRAETAPPVLKFLDPPLLTIINFLHLSKNDNSSLSPFSAHSKYLSTNGFFVSSGPVLLLILTTLTSLFYIKERFLVTITLKQSNGTFWHKSIKHEKIKYQNNLKINKKRPLLFAIIWSSNQLFELSAVWSLRSVSNSKIEVNLRISVFTWEMCVLCLD